jgi:predicted RND superfamily exporter protein
LAKWVIHHPGLFLLLIATTTAVLALGLRDLKVATVFSDLLPSDHEYVAVFKAHPNFGSPLTVQMVIKRTDGDIHHADTLAKVWRITQAIDLIPAIDHDQVLSIATEKARVAVATPFGVESRPLMENHPPKQQQEIDDFRARLEQAPGVATFLVSADKTAALVRATFIEGPLDYGQLFRHLRAIAAKERDAVHEIYVTGLPMLNGWIHFYEAHIVWNFVVTLGAMVLALLLYMRNVAGVVTPLAVSAVSALWGFGFVGWVGYNVEPLIMVVPVLLVARSFSHCVQTTERYYEFLYLGRTKPEAAEATLSALLVPGTLGIVTDAAALFLIGVMQVPMMQKFALFCGFWALTLIPANLFLSPVILTFLPAPKNLQKIVGGAESSPLHRRINNLLGAIARLTYGRLSWPIAAGLILAIVGGAICTSRISVGSTAEGSGLLWPGADYNRAARQLNSHFLGMNTVEIIFEGKAQSAMRRSDTLHTMLQLQRRIESQPDPPIATLSFADYLPEVNRLFNGGHPKWLPLDRDEKKIQGAVNGLLFGANTQAFSHVVDFQLRHGTVTLWLENVKPATLARTVNQAQTAIAAVGAEHEHFRIRLGSGNAALQKAVNERVATHQWVILALLLGVIFLTCAIAYRSLAASVLLLIPVTVANLLLAVVMVLLDISLDLNTLPITAIGIGIGIDYGIYLLSRLREEAERDQRLGAVIQKSLTTTGKAIFFTATVVLVGLLPWYFVSNLKFQANMGLLLALVMLINMAIALLVVPFLVALFKPRFVFAQTSVET